MKVLLRRCGGEGNVSGSSIVRPESHLVRDSLVWWEFREKRGRSSKIGTNEERDFLFRNGLRTLGTGKGWNISRDFYFREE